MMEGREREKESGKSEGGGGGGGGGGEETYTTISMILMVASLFFPFEFPRHLSAEVSLVPSSTL